ncbi:hypothetical protein IV454_20830 [Massilia antarctica]|uniref:DUF1963 domain-containing protein n=1 Tax=Massilia antarctica TaxID=2765360 RepID=A0AA48WAM5_9BURK|nr:hypothetical protein [Massilia antarctica]QPI47994.1 hypothetical protein IV454_20830 [Massilia antarctica]
MAAYAHPGGKRIGTAELIAAFQQARGYRAAYARLETFLHTASSDEIDTFAADALLALPDGAGMIDDVVCRMSPHAFARLAESALDLVEQDRSSAMCDAVLQAASLQIVAALQPHLGRLFEHAPNQGWASENWPWRAALDEDIAFLRAILASDHPQERFKAWRCLLETRQSAAMALAVDAYPSMALAHPLKAFLREVDHDGPGEPLYGAACMHIIFPENHLFDGSGKPDQGVAHPSWTLPAGATTLRFGGAGAGTCGLCAGQLHHLVTLPEHQVFGAAGHAGRDVALEVCLSCLGWERDALFYRHGADGSAEALDHGALTPRHPAVALAPAGVRLAPTPPRWTWQAWGPANGAENLHRVGGHPTWVQSADYPDCPSCARTMHFALQLDSALPTMDGDTWSWGGGGLCYVFQCAPCRIAAYLWQCT